MRTINTMIQQYLRRSRRFYMHLLSDYLSSNFLLSAGKYTLDIGDKIEDKKKHPHLYAEDIRVLLNSFSTQLCINPGIILDKTDNLPYLLQRTQ